jgi:hypothetical protein
LPIKQIELRLIVFSGSFHELFSQAINGLVYFGVNHFLYSKCRNEGGAPEIQKWHPTVQAITD